MLDEITWPVPERTDRARTSFWLSSVPFSRSVAAERHTSQTTEVSNRLRRAGEANCDSPYPTYPEERMALQRAASQNTDFSVLCQPDLVVSRICVDEPGVKAL